MAIPNGVVRVSAYGTLPGGEIWSNSWWQSGAVPTSNDEANALAGLWLEQCTTSEDPGPYHDASLNYWSHATSIQGVNVYCYPNGGPTATYIGNAEGPVTGVQGSALVPNQVCMVISLRTGNAGRRARGRLYMPLDAPIITSDGQFGSAMCSQIANDWAGIFSDWNASGDNGRVVVVSQSATHAYPITEVIVDTRPDVQRRRANRQAADDRSRATVTA